MAGVPLTDRVPYPTSANAIQLAVRTAQGDAYSIAVSEQSHSRPRSR